jgi:hypothetical protein
MNNGALLGRAALRDFLTFAESVCRIEGGVYLSLGSAVMSPMVFEKSLSMSQSIALGRGEKIANHYMLVVDLQPSHWDWSVGEPPENNPDYYLRYCKTFARMGGTMQYLSADNRDFLLALYHELARDLQAIYVGPSAAQCRAVAGEVAQKWQGRAPKMVAALEAGLGDTLTVQELAPEMRRRLKSTNMLERLMRTLKQRTRVVLIFPSLAALERLIGALLLEVQEDWLGEPQRYLVLERQGKF